MLARLVRRATRLTREERRLLLRAFIDLAMTDVALRIFGFQRVERRAAARSSGPPRDDSHAVIRARRYARWLDTASRYHVVRAHCLQRSLVLHSWLRQEALPSSVHIGVRKDGSMLRAHAWVELDGQVVNDRVDAISAFAPLAGLPSESTGARLAAPRDAPSDPDRPRTGVVSDDGRG